MIFIRSLSKYYCEDGRLLTGREQAVQGDAHFQHLLWIVIVSPRIKTIAIGLLIRTQLRQSKVKSILQSIPDKADIIENIDSILS